jgi:hypothetical protein
LIVLHESHEVAEEDDDGYFSDGGDVDGGAFFDFGAEVLESRISVSKQTYIHAYISDEEEKR